MIAGCHYDLHGGAGIMNGQYGIGIHALGAGRRRRIMIDIAADEQCVRSVSTYSFGKLFQESLLLGCTVKL